MAAHRAGNAREAVVVFTRPPEVDAQSKQLHRHGAFLRELARRCLRAAHGCQRADLVVVGDLGGIPLPPGARILPQRGESASERFLQALRDVASLGYERIAAVGTDIAGLSSGLLDRAFAKLEGGRDMVLGPAADGGAYLVGLRTEALSALQEMPWGTSQVLESLLANHPGAYVLERQLSDVDGQSTLRRLTACHLLPHTLAALARELGTCPQLVSLYPSPVRRGRQPAPIRQVQWRGPPVSCPDTRPGHAA